MKVSNVKVGTLELITFRTTRDDHPVTFAANGLISGLSSGHIALRLKFSDKVLYDKYIHQRNNIPHQKIIDPQTKQEEYEVYMSFWPSPIGLPWSEKSILRSYRSDCEESANYSEMQYDQKYAEYFQPLAKIAAPAVPIAKDLLYSTVTLPPTIILHSTRLQADFNQKTNAENAETIVLVAEKFAKLYHEWRRSVINRQNAEYLFETQPTEISVYKRREKIAQVRARVAERNLKQIMYPDEHLTHEQFIKRLENFISLGYPERDIIAIPLVKNKLHADNDQQEIYGLDLEPMLNYICEIAAHPELHPYNVFSNNCARVALSIISMGCKIDQHILGENILELPWYVRWFGITLTPTLTMQIVHKLQIKIEELNTPIFKDEVIANDDDDQCTSEFEPLIKAQHQKFDLNSKPKLMQFYNKEYKEDGPMTRTGILCKKLEDASRMGN